MAARRAFTMVELMIALALFSALMVAVVEASIGIRGYTSQHEDLLELEDEGRTILNHVIKDLSNSGKFPGSANLPAFPSSSATTSSIIPENPIFGDEVWFLRIRSAAPNSAETDFAHLDFSAPVTPMSEWKSPKNIIPGLVAKPDFQNNASERLVTPVWEPIPSPDPLNPTNKLSFAENQDVNNLRVYRYRVVPLGSSGRGALRREFSDTHAAGSPGWQSDSSLPDLGRNVHSFNISGPYDMRLIIRLELRKDVPGRGRAIRHFEAVATMRSDY